MQRVRSYFILAANLLVATALVAAATGAFAEQGGFRVEARIEPPDAPAGSDVDLFLTLHLSPGWTVFDLDESGARSKATRIELDLPPGLSAQGPFDSPTAGGGNKDEGRLQSFERSPTFHRRLAIAADAQPGVRRLSGRIDCELSDPTAGKTIKLSRYPFTASVTIAAPGAAPIRMESSTAERLTTTPPAATKPALPPASAVQSSIPTRAVALVPDSVIAEITLGEEPAATEPASPALTILIAGFVAAAFATGGWFAVRLRIGSRIGAATLENRRTAA